jgi:Fe-S-cluster containining protein
MINIKEIEALLSDYVHMRYAEWQDIWNELQSFYECKQCSPAFCCTIVPVQIQYREAQKITQYLNMNIQDFFMKYTHSPNLFLKTPCPFYTGKVCKVYKARPYVCRRYPFSSAPGVLAIDLCPMSSEIAKDVKALGKVKVDELTRQIMKYQKMYENHPQFDELKEKFGGMEDLKKKTSEIISAIEKKKIPDDAGSFDTINFQCAIESMRKLLKLKHETS